MASPDRRDLGRVFNEVPERYDRVRPTNPDELFADLVAIAGVRTKLDRRRLVGRVVVRRGGLELRGTGVHQLEDRVDPQLLAVPPDAQDRLTGDLRRYTDDNWASE